MKYYLAYGMNTNLVNMMHRCPKAKPIGKIILSDHALKFKYHADAEYSPGNSMECALWLITDECEQNLDRLEGYPVYYDKKTVAVEYDNQEINAMIYYMVDPKAEISTPAESYYAMVLQGYHQFNLNKNLVHEAYEETLYLDIVDIRKF